MKSYIFLLSFFLCIFLFFLFPVGGDGDVFHHLNAGKYIVQNHRLPLADTYTFTASGKQWVDYAWGAGVIFYLIYNSFGPIGINFLVAALAVLTFVLFYLYLRTLRVPMPYALFTLTVIAPVLSTRWPARPELFAYPLLIALFIINQLKISRPRVALFLPILILLWANLYGSSVILGLAIVGLITAQQVIADFRHKNKPALLWYLSAVLSYPLSLVNGYGFKSVLYFFVIPHISQAQTEWAGIMKNFSGPIDYVLSFQYWLLLFLIYVVFFTVVVVLSAKKIKNHIFVSLLSVALVIPFFVFRQVPTAVLLSAPLLAVLLTTQTAKARRLFVVLGLVSIAISIPLSLWNDRRGIGQDTQPYSPAIIAFLQKYHIAGRALNNQRVGAYVSYHLYPDIRVTMDTRDDLFVGTTVMDDFSRTFSSGTSVLPLLAKYNIDVVIGNLADGPSYTPLFYSDTWAVVFLHGSYFIAVPTRIAREKQLPGYTALDPFTESGAKAGKEEEALKEYVQATTADPGSYSSLMRRATMLFSLQRYDESTAALSALKIDSGPKKRLFLVDVYYLFAQNFFARGDCARTKTYLDATARAASHAFLFSPRRVIPTPVNKGYAFYYLLCEKNRTTAQAYVNLYLGQPDVTSSEKTATEKQYQELIR